MRPTDCVRTRSTGMLTSYSLAGIFAIKDFRQFLAGRGSVKVLKKEPRKIEDAMLEDSGLHPASAHLAMQRFRKHSLGNFAVFAPADFVRPYLEGQGMANVSCPWSSSLWGEGPVLVA